MADFDPLDLDVEKLRARFEQRNPKPWKQPSSPLPVDRFVSEMRKQSRSPKIRSPAELAEVDELACPYAIARDGVRWAATYATIKLHQDEVRASATAAMVKFSENVGEGIAVLQNLYGTLSTIVEAQEHAYDPAVDALSSLRGANYLLAAHSTLQRLQRPIQELYVQRLQTAGNIWRIEFTTSLFRVWWVLTGSDPTPSGRFIEFVEAAYQSLGDNVPELKWESAIKTAKKNVKREYGADVQPWHLEHASAATPRISSRQLLDAYAADGDRTFN